MRQITENPDLFYQRMTFDGLNISQIEYYNGCITGRVKNSYLYDADHRLKETKNFMYTPTRVADNYSSHYQYDKAGNILTLSRNGFLGLDSNQDPLYGLIDQLTYTYNSDFFLDIVANDINAASEDYGFKGEESVYSYDDKGNMTGSTLNDLIIEYNHINLPGVLSSDFGSQSTHYSLGGSKILTVNEYTDPLGGPSTELTRMYFMGLELEYEGAGSFSSTFTPISYQLGDGRLLFDGSDIRKRYHLHDHLGNVVVVFEDKDNDGLLEETSLISTNEVPNRYHYYSRRDLGASTEEPLARPNPAGERDSFGMLWVKAGLGLRKESLVRPNHATLFDQSVLQRWSLVFNQTSDLKTGVNLPDPLTPLYSDDNRYHYNGKEFERVANLLDYGWRWYDPVVGRWNGVDPLADHPNQIHLSPFAYAWNNPILLIDPDGLCPKCPPSPDPSSSGTTIRHAYSQSFRLMAHPYQQMIKSGYNRLANFFSPGEAQQHSGDNVVNYGKGSPSGYEVPGSHANPEGNTHAIEGFFDALPGVTPSNSLGKGVLNPIMHVDGFNNTVNTLVDNLSPSNTGKEATINSELGGARTEINPSNHGWLGESPSPGVTDTIVNPNGSRTVMHRSEESGTRSIHTID